MTPSTTAFLPPVPLSLLSPAPSSRAARCVPPPSPLRAARATRPRAAAPPPGPPPAAAAAAAPAAPASLAPCIPADEAAAITDPYAQALLARVQYTPIETALPHGTIGTAHVHSPAVGDSSAPSLVLLPGFDSNILEFRYMLPLLDALPIDVHLVDPLGCGLTETRVAAPGEAALLHFGPGEKRAHLAAFLSAMVAPERAVILAGASLGGATALHYHLTEDEAPEDARRAAALVLIDAQAFTDRRVGDRPPSAFAARVGARVLRANWLRRLAMWLSYERRTLRTDDDVFRIGRLHCGRAGWMESMVDFIRRDAYCLSERVGETSVPTLVLWGDNDRVMPKGDAERFGEAVADCRVQYVASAGHSPHIEQPEAVTEYIADFVRKLS